MTFLFIGRQLHKLFLAPRCKGSVLILDHGGFPDFVLRLFWCGRVSEAPVASKMVNSNNGDICKAVECQLCYHTLQLCYVKVWQQQQNLNAHSL